MRALVLVGVLLLSMVGCGEGCGCDGGSSDETASDRRAREPVDPPAGLTWEASVAGAGALEAVREQLPPHLRPVVPSSPGALLERIAPQLPVADRVPDDAVVWALAVEVDGSERMVLAAPVSIADGARPFGPEVPALSGAPHGGLWIGQVPGRDDDAAMLLDDVLLVSESPRALEAAGPYLAFTLVPRDSPGSIRMRLPDGFVSETLRRAGDRMVSHQARRATAAARAERERHETPPIYGDPEALVAAARDLVRELLAFLPDVGEVVVTLGAGDAGLRLGIDAAVADGSPLAEALEESIVGPPYGIAALPRDTALAWATRTARDPDPSFVAATLRRIGGERLGATGAEALETLDDAVGNSRGEGVVVAFGADGSSPWALAGSGPADAALDARVVRGALGAPYLRDVVGGLAGCGGPASTRRTEPASGRTILCTTAADRPTLLDVANAEGAWTVSIARGRTDAATSTAARLGGGGDGGLGDNADVARALSSLGDQVLAAAVIVPSRLLPAAALSPFDALWQAGAETAPGARTGPIVLAASRTEDGLRLEILATAASIEDLAAVAEPFTAD